MSSLQTEITLPSRGKIYKNPAWSRPVVLNMIDGAWEKRLYGSTRGGELIDEMLNSLIEGDLNVDELHPSDKFFIMMKQRIHSYGDDYHVLYRCPVCGKTGEAMISLDDVNVVEMPEDYSLFKEGELPISGDKLRTRELLSGDYKKIKRRVAKLCTGTQVNEREQSYITTSAARIVTINGEEKTTMEKEKYFTEMVGKDLRTFRKLCSRPPFGYVDKTLVKCAECKSDVEADVVMTGEFFRPRDD